MVNKSEKILLTEVIQGIENMKGENIKHMDLTKIENTPFKFFVICTGTSNTHVTAIVNSVKKIVSKALKEKPYHTEGLDIAEWVLIDYIDVVVHVFQKHIREYYNIEELWGDASCTPIVSN